MKKIDRLTTVYVMDDWKVLLLKQKQGFDFWFPAQRYITDNEYVHQSLFKLIVNEIGMSVIFEGFQSDNENIPPQPYLTRIENKIGNDYRENFIFLCKPKHENMEPKVRKDIEYQWIDIFEAIELPNIFNDTKEQLSIIEKMLLGIKLE